MFEHFPHEPANNRWNPICRNLLLRPRAELCRRHLDKLYCSGFGAAFKNRRAKTPADIIKDNPQAPTETEIRVFPRHLTGHPYWKPFIPFYVDLYEDDWSSEPFKTSSGRKNRTPNRKVAPKTWILDFVVSTSVQFWFVPFKFKVGIFGFTCVLLGYSLIALVIGYNLDLILICGVCVLLGYSLVVLVAGCITCKDLVAIYGVGAFLCYFPVQMLLPFIVFVLSWAIPGMPWS